MASLVEGDRHHGLRRALKNTKAEVVAKVVATGCHFRPSGRFQFSEKCRNHSAFVDRDGIEPPTQGFSVLCSTN
jgi:hypothetical protein